MHNFALSYVRYASIQSMQFAHRFIGITYMLQQMVIILNGEPLTKYTCVDAFISKYNSYQLTVG